MSKTHYFDSRARLLLKSICLLKIRKKRKTVKKVTYSETNFVVHPHPYRQFSLQ